MSTTRQPYQDGSEAFERIKSYYTIPEVTNLRRIFTLVSDRYNDFLSSESRNDFNEIVSGIYLGRAPRKDGFTMPAHLGMVIGVVAYQEVAGIGIAGNVYTPTDWASQNVLHIHLNMLDMTNQVTHEDLDRAADSLKTFLDQQQDSDNPKKVYIHCKAGRSRSAMFLAYYLAKYGCKNEFELTGDKFKDLDRAFQFIKSKRPHVDVWGSQTQLARETLTMFGDSRSQASSSSPSKFDTLDTYLGSLDAKDEIRKLTSFKAIARYATEIQSYYRSTQRTGHVRDLFSDILHASDGGWFARLVNKEGATHRLLSANKDGDDQARREELVANFTGELGKLFAAKGFDVDVERRAGLAAS